MNLFNLDKKLTKIHHEVSKEDFLELKLNKEEFEKAISAELIKQFAMQCMLPIKTMVQNDGTIEFNGSGYVLSERDMLNVINEILDLDDKGRELLSESVKKELGLS